MNAIRTKKTGPAALVALCVMLSGCVASQQDVRTLDLRIRTLNNRMDSVDRDLGDLREQTTMRAEKDSVEALRKSLARSTAEMERLRADLLKLKGNIEEVAHRATVSREENQDYVNDLGQRMAEAEQAVKGLDSRVAAIEKRLAALSGEMENRLAEVSRALDTVGQRLKGLDEATAALRGETESLRERMRKAAEEAARRRAEAAARAAREAERRARRPVTLSPRKVKVRGVPAAAPAAGAGRKAAAAPGRSLYDAGVADFKAGRYRDAYLKFSTYLEKNPGSELAGDARFWLGDCLYRQKEYSLAILEYQKLVDDYRHHPRRPAALLKQGLAFEKLADRKTAKIVYLKLLKLYPGRPEADTARKRLNALASR